MTADELSAPLGQMPRKQRRKFPIAVPNVIAGALALFLGTFVLWTIVGDDPFGGERWSPRRSTCAPLRR
jgi:hypothetical protein